MSEPRCESVPVAPERVGVSERTDTMERTAPQRVPRYTSEPLCGSVPVVYERVCDSERTIGTERADPFERAE